MSVQVKGSGTIGGLDEGLVVSGIITSSTQLNVGSDIKLGSAGVVTATTFSGSGASLTNLPAGNLTGTVADARISTLTASKLTGALPAISGANLTGITGTTINNEGSDRIITSTSTANTIHAESNLSFSVNQLTIAHADPKIALVDTTNNTDAYIFSDDNGSIRFQADQNSEASDTRIRFQTDGSEKVSIDSELKIFNGNLFFGTSGKGVNFHTSNSGTANLLDDYEEGSHSPNFANLNNQSHVTTNFYTYVKVGRIVQISCKFTVSSSISDASGFGFTIPFAQKASRQMVMTGLANRTGTQKQPFCAFSEHAQSYFYLKTLEGYSSQDYNYFSGNIIWVSGSYESDS